MTLATLINVNQEFVETKSLINCLAQLIDIRILVNRKSIKYKIKINFINVRIKKA
jgi:hypothetical protein